jgi:predicted MPP superfamily phosphohydrolase
MAVFLLIVLSIYALVNAYIFRRGWQALADFPWMRWVYAAVLLALVLSYPLARMVPGAAGHSAGSLLVRTGSFYLALMLYLFMGVVLVDVVRLANAFRRFMPGGLTASSGRAGLVLFLAVGGAAVLVVGLGASNASRPRIRQLSVAIVKPVPGSPTLTMAVASDLHLGLISGSAWLRPFVDRVNALEPDIVLLPGDIVDESVTAEEEDRLTTVFRKLRAPLGVYAVPGNHETYSGLERNVACLERCGVIVLQDRAVKVADSFYVIGRRDPSSLQRGERRIPLPRIMTSAGVDTRLPMILLDHQPLHLEEAEAVGIDLELCGHTHAGQLFPLNLINKRIYEQNWGYLRKGKTQYYVSCGVGTWGPPVRTGSTPEIMKITLSFGTAR